MKPYRHLILIGTLFVFALGNGNSLVAQPPVGRWRGEWMSGSNGHHGPMRANIRPMSNGNFSARYSGRFFVVIPFTYRVDLVPAGNGQFVADKKLGPILGSYRMQTVFGPNMMNGQFQAAGDNGTVRMTKVSR